MITNAELKDKFNMGDDEIAQLEIDADLYDNGEWPAGITTSVGRPKLSGEETKAVTFKIPASLLTLLDNKANELGQTRSSAIRDALTEWL